MDVEPPEQTRLRLGCRVSQHLEIALAAHPELAADATSMKRRFVLLQRIAYDWRRKHFKEVRLREAVAVLAAKRKVAWNPNSGPYEGLVKLACPHLNKGRISELAMLLQEARGTEPELAKRVVENFGGVDKTCRGLKRAETDGDFRKALKRRSRLNQVEAKS